MLAGIYHAGTLFHKSKFCILAWTMHLLGGWGRVAIGSWSSNQKGCSLLKNKSLIFMEKKPPADKTDVAVIFPHTCNLFGHNARSRWCCCLSKGRISYCGGKRVVKCIRYTGWDTGSEDADTRWQKCSYFSLGICIHWSSACRFLWLLCLMLWSVSFTETSENQTFQCPSTNAWHLETLLVIVVSLYLQ